MELFVSLLGGMVTIMRIALGAWVLAVALGLVFALAMRSRFAVIRESVYFLTAALRGTPELLLIYIVFYGLSGASGISLDPVSSVIVAVGVIYAGFAAEIYRSAFFTVPYSQVDAAHSLGLRSSKTMALVVLPLAGRFALAPLANLLLGLMKVATYGSAVGVAEVVYLATNDLQRTGNIASTMFLIALIYVAVTLPISWGLRGLESKTRMGELVS
jgi:amine acid ABC transporter, permease protein, 3-TM region, His/Glu/Gln/Arg/opine family